MMVLCSFIVEHGSQFMIIFLSWSHQLDCSLENTYVLTHNTNILSQINVARDRILCIKINDQMNHIHLLKSLFFDKEFFSFCTNYEVKRKCNLEITTCSKKKIDFLLKLHGCDWFFQQFCYQCLFRFIQRPFAEIAP